MTNKFAHLHVHTDYSMLDGASKLDELFTKVAADDQPAVAMTDHGVLFGLVDFYQKAKKAGVKPILGSELYQAIGSRHDKNLGGATGKERYHHITALAMNNVGYHNLMALSTRAYLEGTWYKPRVDHELIAEHSDGMIFLSGCLSGEINQLLLQDRYRDAKEAASKMKDIFGPERYYIELMDHGIDKQKYVFPGLEKLAKELGLKTVITNDSHYTEQEDAEAHDALLCIQTGAQISDEKRFRFTGPDYYLKTAEEMYRQYPDHHHALQATLDIAEMVDTEIEFGLDLLPAFPCPDGMNESEYLRHKTWEGAKQKYSENLPENVTKRVQYELDVIDRMGFPAYFLIVADLCDWARDNGVRVGPGRGCLRGEELIWTADGYKEIRDVEVGDLVRTHTGAVRPVTNCFRYDVDEPLVTLRTFSDGQGVTMTSDHKVLIRRAEYETDVRRLKGGAKFSKGVTGETEWVAAGDVNVDDFVCVPRPPSPGTAPDRIDVAELLPEATGKTRHEITGDSIIEHVPVNESYEHSVRDVAKKTGVSRNSIRAVLGHADRYSSTLSCEAGTLRPTQTRSRDTLLTYLKGAGFPTFESWERHLEERSYTTVVTPRYVDVNEDLCWFMGAWVANGWLRTDSNRVVGLAEQRSTADDQVPLNVKRIWGLETTRVPHAKSDLVQWDIRSVAVRALIRHLALNYQMDAKTKHLPAWVNDLDMNQKRAMLDGMFWGDGHLTDHRWTYSTSSYELARQVRDLIWSVGSTAGLDVDERVDEREEFTNRAKSWRVRTIPNFAAPPLQYGHVDERYVYMRVRDTFQVEGVREVFDFEVDVDHSFMTDSFVVHNSAAGSIVAYCTDIVRADPLKHDLLFERFLNPDRASMPDIDIDFDDRNRGRMIEYAAERYGADRVSQVVTFGTIKAKSAMKDAARVLSEPYQIGDNLTKMMPAAAQGRESTLTEAYGKSGDLRAAREDPTYKKVLETAEKLEGLKRQHGIHAAAVIIGAKPLVESVPLMLTEKGEVVTQYEMNAAEAIGLLKMDFLGLRNLTVIADAQRNIADNKGVDVEVDNADFLGEMDDPETFEMLAAGNTLGVFQLDSPGMQALVKRLKPDRFEDISALLALYRPGPLAMDMHTVYADRKNGLQKVEFDHPDLEPILGDTYGVIVYQEQVMRVATDLCGFTLAEADALRKAVGKKIRELMEAQKDQFIDGGVNNGYDRKFIAGLWDMIETFAEYGFNKSHTVAYGIISYQTAWLKAHYPVEYMAALLTSVRNNKDQKPIYLNECRHMDIEVLLPDVNESNANFTPRGDNEIRFGLSAVRGVGEGIVEKIVDAREQKGKFKDFRDFCRKVDSSVLKKNVLENLISAGAFLSMGHSRKGLLDVFTRIVDAASSSKKAEDAGQFSLFAGMDETETDDAVTLSDGAVIEDVEYEPDHLLKLERQMLGLYVSDHPLSGAEQVLARHTKNNIGDLVQMEDGQKVTVGGVITATTKKVTRKGDGYMLSTFEDLTGDVEVVFWPATFRTAHEVLTEDAILVLTGRLEIREGVPKVTVDKVMVPNIKSPEKSPIVVTLPSAFVDMYVGKLKKVLSNHPGKVPVHLNVEMDNGKTQVYELGDGFRVSRSPGLFGELKAEIGPSAIKDTYETQVFEGERRNNWQ